MAALPCRWDIHLTERYQSRVLWEVLVVVSADLLRRNKPIPSTGLASNFTNLLTVSAAIVVAGDTECGSISYGCDRLGTDAGSQFQWNVQEREKHAAQNG